MMKPTAVPRAVGSRALAGKLSTTAFAVAKRRTGSTGGWMTIFRSGLALAALLLLIATDLPAQVDIGSDTNPAFVLAPAVFSSPDGSPATRTTSFALPSLIYGPFTLLVENNGATEGNIELNGTSIFGAEDIGAQSTEDIVELSANNNLQVELSGSAGATLTVTILGSEYEFAADYANLPVMQAATTALTELDWRSKGAVTPVKNQGQCDADWAFSATGAMEGWSAVVKGKLPSLAEQQLIDCARSFGSLGCNGGSPVAGLEFGAQTGLCTSASYPYAIRDDTCKRQCSPVVKSSKVIRVPIADEQTLAAAVVKQPVSVVFNGDWLRDYKGGIADPVCGKDSTPKYAAALIVGFGQTDAKPPVKYWLLKNSWGTAWGDNGYFKLVRGTDKCGIADYASFPQ